METLKINIHQSRGGKKKTLLIISLLKRQFSNF